MKKVGFFLAYDPGLDIKNQGIARLLGFILSGMPDEIEVVIAIPRGYKKDMLSFLIELNIDNKKIKLLTSSRVFLKHKINRKTKISNTKKTGYYALIKALFSPLFFLRGKARKILKLIKKTRQFIGKICFQWEKKDLVKKANRQHDVDLWFVPTIFWPEIKDIKARKVVAAPDIVISDFPTLFPVEYARAILNNIKISLSAADKIVCYSQYVKEKHLVSAFKVPESKVVIIKHGMIDQSVYLRQDAASQTQTAQKIIRNFQEKHLANKGYVSLLDFTQIKFIFYSSQARPHKNLFNLIKAYEILLRNRYISEKLVITGNLKDLPELNKYVLSRRLQYDVISLTELPSEVLAAFNQLAVCAVNPTLFEGGFPFTFTEAYSVGTPSIMSRIPVVLEEIKDEALQKSMLFDPYNVKNMVDKIQWALLNRQKLYNMQRCLFEQMKQRAWSLVAQEYINLFDSVSKNEND